MFSNNSILSAEEETFVAAVQKITKQDLKKLFFHFHCIIEIFEEKHYNEHLDQNDKTQIIFDYVFTENIRGIIEALQKLENVKNLASCFFLLPPEVFVLNDILTKNSHIHSHLHSCLYHYIIYLRTSAQYQHLKSEQPLAGWVGMREINKKKLELSKEICIFDHRRLEQHKKFLYDHIDQFLTNKFLQTTDGIENIFLRMKKNFDSKKFTLLQFVEIKNLKNHYLDKLQSELINEQLNARDAIRKVKSSKLINYRRPRFLNVRPAGDSKARKVADEIIESIVKMNQDSHINKLARINI